MLKVLSNILCDLDPKVKVIGQKAGICDGVPSTSALVIIIIINRFYYRHFQKFLEEIWYMYLQNPLTWSVTSNKHF